MRKYQPSNRVPFASFILLLLIGAVSGAAVGGILWALDNYAGISLVFVFPLVAGAIIGGLLAIGVRAGKVRSPFVAGLIGLLAALLAYGVYQAAGYAITFRAAARDAYLENVGKSPTEAQIDKAINNLLLDETGETGLLGYWRLSAQTGFSITRTSSSSTGSGIEVIGDWVYVYWLAEVVIAAAAALWLAARAARQPFDEDANAWYGKPERVAVAGVKSRRELVRALKDGDFQKAGGLLSTQALKYPRHELLIRRSPSSDVLPQDVYVTVAYAQRANRSSPVASGVIAPSEYDLLIHSMHQAERQNALFSATSSR